jgi:hypothetical protein
MTRLERANKLCNDLSEINPGSDQIDLVIAYSNELRWDRVGELSKVKEILCGIELNWNNYSEGEVRELQNNMLEGIGMLDAIIEKSGK